MDGIINSFFWIVGAGLWGFSVSAFFSNVLKLSRRVFLIPYVLITAIFLIVFFSKNLTDYSAFFVHNWQGGVITGVIVAIFLVRSVFSQPESQKLKAWELGFDIAWLGLVYGIIDGLFLNIMPVGAIKNAVISIAWSNTIPGRVGVGALALIASLLITLVYHLGYSEFRNKSVKLVLLGNALITLTYIISANPLGAILSHTAMHVAAVIRGPETTIQLPPHQLQVKE